MSEVRLFPPKETCILGQLTYRQLQYWDRTGFLSPSVRRRGKYRQYSFIDILLMRFGSECRDRRILSIQKMRQRIERIHRAITSGYDPQEISVGIHGDKFIVTTGLLDLDDKNDYHWIHLKDLIAEITRDIEQIDKVADELSKAA